MHLLLNPSLLPHSHKNFFVVFTVAEELGMLGANQLDLSAYHAPCGFVFDCSQRPGIYIQKCAGSAVFRAKILGKAAHAGVAPEEGLNAILLAATALAKIPSGRLDAETTVNIAKISGGKALNIVPDEVVVEGEVRSFTTQRIRAQLAVIQRQFHESKNGGAMEFDSLIDFEPYVLDLDSSVVATAFSLKITRQQAETDSALQLLNGITGVFFSGGDQSRLTAVLKGTKVESWLHQFYQRGGVVAGTSAGAAVMSQVMITGDQRRPVGDSSFNKIEAENIVTTAGFGFMQNAIVDQHFVRRRRHNRLLSLVLENPQLIGLGIDESTAIWVKPNGTFEVIGESTVIVYDATKANVKKAPAGYDLSAEGLGLHVLQHGSIYDLNSKRIKRLN